VSLVVHVDPPADPKDYLHRAGRTARAGESGTVVTLVLPEQRREVDQMTRQAGITAVGSKVRAGDPALATLTGAKTPTGTPVEDLTAGGPPQQQGRRRARPEGSASRGGRSGGNPGRSGGNSGRSGASPARAHSAASVSQGGPRHRRSA
jgi:superfamily II DNA/RNA helicase